MSKTRDQLHDELLVLRAQAGDAKAFTELVERWQKRLWRYAYHLLGSRDAAWETIQDSWIGIIGGIGRLKDPASFPGWAFRIVHNRHVDRMRRRHRRNVLVERLHRDEAGGREPPCSEGAAPDVSILEFLPAETRSLLVLRYGEGFSIEEIAGILGIPEGTVKSRLFHARERVRRLRGEKRNEAD